MASIGVVQYVGHKVPENTSTGELNEMDRPIHPGINERIRAPGARTTPQSQPAIPDGDRVGPTPLVELRRLCGGLPGRVVVKLESRNPTGSIKDRVAAALVDEAEASGKLSAESTIVAATSGNTGVALARIAAQRGCKLRLTIPEQWSHERLPLLLYLGADVILTPGSGMQAAAERARALAGQLASERAVLLDQFASEANREIHRTTTAEEIWSATSGEVSAFVAGVGTAGTITGVALGLRAKKPDVRVVAVEPAAAPVLSGGKPGRHGIQGIGAGFVPPLFRSDLVDEIVAVRDAEAFEWTRRLARQEGLLGGVSSGAAVCAAVSLASRKQMAGKLIVTVVSDSAERYVITPRVAAHEGVGGPRR
jgi:cysteine synthase